MSPPSIPKPTVGRVVLVTVADSTEREFTIPAIVTHVHSERTISVVAFSAFGDAGTGADGTKPITSIVHGTGPNTWRWMDYQLGQAQKTESVADALAKRVEVLEAQLIALNQKQPASQRVAVADPSLDVPMGAEPMTHEQFVALINGKQSEPVSDPSLSVPGGTCGKTDTEIVAEEQAKPA